MNLEFVFKGNPQQFAVVMAEFRQRLPGIYDRLILDFYTTGLPYKFTQTVHVREEKPQRERRKTEYTGNWVIGLTITAQTSPNNDRSILYVDISDKYQSRAIEAWESIASKMREQKWMILPKEKKPGRRLKHDDLIYRLAKAQEAEELRRQDPQIPWKQIAIKIKWKAGASKPGIKSLEDARDRLKAFRKSDPDNLLGEVKEWRERNKS